ncbi:hypothetical protein [Wolbachia pipientis]|uniref:hypothetical protein n=1 Tax=Wolbachia pipientis TaxID=955 RepID=UPI001C71135D|nr:hypothetical protein [Wolbachia pipientis]
MLSYNDCEEIRDIYTGYRIIRPKWSYGMGNSKKSNEILILSKDYGKFQYRNQNIEGINAN